jgi:hypothetical protein
VLHVSGCHPLLKKNSSSKCNITSAKVYTKKIFMMEVTLDIINANPKATTHKNKHFLLLQQQ